MKKDIFTFRIELLDIEPSIWRLIQVPSAYTFWDLHIAIQDSMGWMDCHLHLFNNKEFKIGIPDEDFDDGTIAGWETPITKHFLKSGDNINYDYDFGDGWEHIVTLKDISTSDPEKTYPICLDGKRACPPEDCGGPYGYTNMLETLKKPNSEECIELKEWLEDVTEGIFDPEKFNPTDIDFNDPAKKFDNMFLM